MGRYLDSPSYRPKGFLKMFRNFDIWDDAGEDFSKLDFVLNVETSKSYNPHWEPEYFGKDFIVYVNGNPLPDEHLSQLKDLSRQYCAHVGIVAENLGEEVLFHEFNYSDKPINE